MSDMAEKEWSRKGAKVQAEFEPVKPLIDEARKTIN